MIQISASCRGRRPTGTAAPDQHAGHEALSQRGETSSRPRRATSGTYPRERPDVPSGAGHGRGRRVHRLLEPGMASETVYEAGWSVLPEFQGQGIAVAAATALIEFRGRRPVPVAACLPVAGEPRLQRGLPQGRLRAARRDQFEFPPGTPMRSNDWSTAPSPVGERAVSVDQRSANRFGRSCDRRCPRSSNGRRGRSSKRRGPRSSKWRRGRFWRAAGAARGSSFTGTPLGSRARSPRRGGRRRGVRGARRRR